MNNENKNQLKTIDIKMQIIIVAVLIPFIFVALWGFFGVIQVREDVMGVLARVGKTVNVYAPEDSFLLDFNIAAEDYIEREHIIARLEQSDLIDEINQMMDDGEDEQLIEQKRAELYSRSLILSPETGRVVETFVHAGDYVQRGQKLATISREAPNEKAVECLLYASLDKVKNVKEGMEVNVYPANINSKVYGNLKGIVISVSDLPITRSALADVVGEALADEFLKDGVLYEIYATLNMDEKNVTGYKWTTSTGPDQKFGNLTICDASIITEEMNPIKFFLGL